MYDAIIVGARCAGAPTAMLLGRKGYKVLMVDRATFPSDTLSTHYIHQPGVRQLKRWGLLAKIVASGCPPITNMTLDVGPFALSGFAPLGDIAVAYAPRRHILDSILIDAAIATGVEFRQAFVVDELLFAEGRVAGLVGHGRDGQHVTERARIVVGADGRNSRIALAVNAPVYDYVPSLTCGYYSYWRGVAVTQAELYPRDGRFIVTFPTNDDLTCIAVQWLHADFAEFRADIEGNFMRTLDLAPDLATRVRQGERVDKFYGTAEMPNFFRKPYGDGWALVGDAGFHHDPNTGMGITNAFRDVELLAGALDAGFSGQQPIADALATYEQQRNAIAMPVHQVTLQLASLQPPPPDMQQLLGALRGNQEDTNRYLGITNYVTPVSEFFAPDNVARIIRIATVTA